MLGLAPISARPISGGTFGLVNVPSAITATGTLTFAGSARWGAFLAAHATGLLRFSGSARWSSLNAISASATLTFAGSALLKVAGRPIVFYAVPERLTFTGLSDRLSFTAKADNFTFRGMR